MVNCSALIGGLQGSWLLGGNSQARLSEGDSYFMCGHGGARVRHTQNFFWIFLVRNEVFPSELVKLVVCNLFFLFHRNPLNKDKILQRRNLHWKISQMWRFHTFNSYTVKVSHLADTTQRCHSDISAPDSRPPLRPSSPGLDHCSLRQTQRSM